MKEMLASVLEMCGVSGAGEGHCAGSVYEDAMEMLASALTIYIFADLRDIARGGTALELSALEPPMTNNRMLEHIVSHRHTLMAACKSYDNLEVRLAALQNLYAHETDGGWMARALGDNRKSLLVQFVDTNAKNEMVHAIVVDDYRKRISVTFRGSVTTTDFITDAKLNQVKVDNPVYGMAPDNVVTETMYLHGGFTEYLFKVNTDTSKTRLQTILDDVKELLRSHAGYRLYCTGHSLGGALSTLCGFYAAADDELMTLAAHRAVRVVSIASPYVGNVKFLLAFQQLERSERLQHLRIANAEDLVTLMPFASPKLGSLSPMLAMKNGAGNLYRHVGMKLRLVSTPTTTDDNNDREVTCEFSFPQDHSTDEACAKEITDMAEDGKYLFRALGLLFKKDISKLTEFHSCEEYEARLERCKHTLANVTMDDLYNDTSIVGDMMKKDHVPRVMISAAERASRIVNSETVRGALWSLFGISSKNDTDTPITVPTTVTESSIADSSNTPNNNN